MTHKFYCERCNVFVYADTMDKLSERLNLHMTLKHPDLYSHWTPVLIEKSANYETADGPPAYLAKSPRYDNTDWGSGKKPELTDDDKKWLQGVLIKW